MLLFQKRFHEGLVRGEITVTFRLWQRARVKAGGRYRCHPIGVLQVDAIDRIRVAEIGESDAQRSGFENREELLSYLQTYARQPLGDRTPVFRVRLHYDGEADYLPLAGKAEISPDEFEQILARLRGMDERSHHGPWTEQTLALIEASPRVAASKLARGVGRETKPFKADVVKLKRMGLTQSFEVGYAITPRGRTFLRRKKRLRH